MCRLIYNDGGGHIVFKVRDNFICILCDIWFPIKWWRK